MKSLVKLLSLLVLFISCSHELMVERPGTPDGLISGFTDFEIGMDGGSITIPVVSDFAFETGDASKDWLSVSKMQEESSMMLVLRASKNTCGGSRRGSITLRNGGTKATVSVIQGSSKELISGTKSFEAGSRGGELRIPVTSDAKYSCTVMGEASAWIDVIAAQEPGIEPRLLIVDVAENTQRQDRVGQLKLTGDDVESIVTITQSRKGEIVVSSGPFEIGSKGGRLEIPFESNVDCVISVISGSDWLKVDKSDTKALNSSSLKLTVAENGTYDNRNGQVRIVGEGKKSVVTVSQSQLEELIIGRTNYTVGRTGGFVDITVETNAEVQCEVLGTAGAWLSLMPSVKSLSFKNIQLSAALFDGPQMQRVGQVRIKGAGKESIMTVFQRGGDKAEISINTPGMLNTKLAEYDVSSITELRLSGVLNDEDLSCFRSTLNSSAPSMLNLQFLDIEDVVVSDIAANTFNGYTNLMQILLPPDLKTIGDGAFYNCVNLQSIVIPESVTSVGNRAFAGCENLHSFDGACPLISSDRKSILDIRDGVLVANLLSGVTCVAIPDGVSMIGEYAFAYTDIQSVIIPGGMKNIGRCAFYACRYLKSLEIPPGVTTIGDNAFSECYSLITAVIPDSITSIGNEAFYNCRGLTSVTIPSGVTSIGDSAFYGCRGLTSITIPSGVTSIGDYAFFGCYCVTSVTIPSGVTSIGDLAFYGCTGVLNVNCDIPDATVTEEYPYYRGPFSISSFSSIIIGSGVASIGDYAFYYSTRLTSITIPSSVTSIGDSAFYGCSGLTSVTIPSSVTSIGDLAFYGCTGVLNVNCDIPDATVTEDYPYYCSPFSISSFSSIIIGSGVASIGDYAFYYSTRLTSITIPSSVTSIGDSAFYGCSGLTDIYCKSLTPPRGSFNMFDGVGSNAKIYVPMASVDLYKNANYWNNYSSIIVGYEY